MRTSVLLLLAAAPALAHAPSFPLRGAVELGRDGVSLMLVQDVFRGPAAAALRLEADADHDGAFSPAEREVIAERLCARAVTGLAASIDGRAVTFAPKECKLTDLDGSARSDAPLAVAVWLRSAGALAPGRHTLELVRGRAGQDAHADLVVQGASGARVLRIEGARQSRIPGTGRAWRLAAGRAARFSVEVR